MPLIQSFLRRLSRTAWVRSALARPMDPSELRRRPGLREWMGLGLIAFSYLIGWPAVAAFAYLAYSLREPLVLAVGGPVIYGISHVVFLVGAWMAGRRYLGALLRLATRKGYERYLPEALVAASTARDGADDQARSQDRAEDCAGGSTGERMGQEAGDGQTRDGQDRAGEGTGERTGQEAGDGQAGDGQTRDGQDRAGGGTGEQRDSA